MTHTPSAPPPDSAGRTAKTWAGLSTVTRECLLVVLAGLALSVLMTWPTLLHPTTTLPQNLGDPSLMGWEVQWGWHAVLHQPLHLFDANAFYPDALSYAFSDTLLGYFPLGILGQGPHAALLDVNLIYVFSCALASIGGYALARQLGANRLGSAVAGLALGYAPWRLTQVSHEHVISTGGIILSLAMLARGHGFSLRDGYRPERVRTGWIIGGWLVGAWQMSIGFGIGLPFAYVLVAIGIVSVVRWYRSPQRPQVSRSTLLANLGGGAVFAVVSALMARPYLQVVAQHPYARRSESVLHSYSPPIWGYFIGSPDSLWWHHDLLGLQRTIRDVPEMALLPGLVLWGLAIAGIWRSSWSKPWRKALAWLTGLTVLLGCGTTVPPGGRLTYVVLYYVLPGWDAIRTPGRLIVWTTIGLALLAAGTVTALARSHAGTARAWLDKIAVSWRGRSITWGSAAGVLAAALVLAEGISVMPHPTFPTAPPALTGAHADVVRPPILVLPSNRDVDVLVMVWSTDGFPKTVNGTSGFDPDSQVDIRVSSGTFPDVTSVAALRRYGVRTVVVLRDRIAGTPWARAPDAPIDGLQITRQEIGDDVVFTLS